MDDTFHDSLKEWAKYIEGENLMNHREILEQSVDEHQRAIDKAKKKLANLSTKFEMVVHGGGTLKMRVLSRICGHESLIRLCIKTPYNQTNTATATASIAEAYEIREALSRLIALAERSQ